MKNLQWTYVDKSDWPDGPWLREPDKIQWMDSESGLPCLIVRGPSGALCGYVGVDEQHPWHGLDYNDSGVWVQVHGGLTYSEFCAENTEHGICHKTEPGDPDPVWWLGFDCAHLGDLTPGYHPLVGCLPDFPGDTYKDVSYVKEQCQKLAQQLIEITSKETMKDGI